MKLSIYYHIWAPFDDYLVRFLIDEQIKRLELHSLTNQATLNVCVVGAAAQVIADYVKKIYGANVRKVELNEEGWELHTLKILHDDCKADPNQNVMYMHTKGLSHYYRSPKNTPHLTNTNTWRHFMELVCIDKWRDCVKELQEFDAVGMNLMSQPFVHFSGNYWWARGTHIIKLKDPFQDSHLPPVQGYKGIQQRHNAESWVCSSPGKFRTKQQVHGSMYHRDKFSQYKIAHSQ